MHNKYMKMLIRYTGEIHPGRKKNDTDKKENS